MDSAAPCNRFAFHFYALGYAPEGGTALCYVTRFGGERRYLWPQRGEAALLHVVLGCYWSCWVVESEPGCLGLSGSNDHRVAAKEGVIRVCHGGVVLRDLLVQLIFMRRSFRMVQWMPRSAREALGCSQPSVELVFDPACMLIVTSSVTGFGGAGRPRPPRLRSSLTWSRRLPWGRGTAYNVMRSARTAKSCAASGRT